LASNSAPGIFDGAIFQAFIWPFRTILRVVMISALLLLWTIITQSWFANTHHASEPLQQLIDVMKSDMDYAAGLTPLAFSPTKIAWGIGEGIQDYGFGVVLSSARTFMNIPSVFKEKSHADADLGKTYVDTTLMRDHGDKIKLWVTASYIFGARIAMFLSILPLLALLYMFGVIDGISRRAIRRSNAERESASIYHRAKLGQIWLGAVSLTAYLALPISVNPAMLLPPLAVTLAYLVRTQIATYKKYL
jgi:integrating conjugative element membrane protein (TIGR03747 family)